MKEAPVKIMLTNIYFKCKDGMEFPIKNHVAPMLPENLYRQEYSYRNALRKVPKSVKILQKNEQPIFRIEYLKEIDITYKNVGISETMIN